jgi:hypothetical protein
LVGEIQNETSGDLLVEIRAAFDRRDWDRTLAVYEQMGDTLKSQRSLRVEATCLAARALIARNDRSGGRSLLKWIAESEYRKPIHYHFIAQAFLDLRNYKEAARACEHADALIEAEKAGNAA